MFTEADTRYAWRLAAALTFVLTLGSGFVFYNLSVYLNVLSIQHGFSVASMSGAITLMFLVGAPVGIVVGRLIQRHDLRIIMTVGAVLGVILTVMVAYWLEVSFELQRLDWRYLPAGIVALWVLSSLAAFEPARRAASVPPAVATRSV